MPQRRCLRYLLNREPKYPVVPVMAHIRVEMLSIGIWSSVGIAGIVQRSDAMGIGHYCKRDGAGID